MAQKPTYEKLEQRIKELEKAARERRKTKRPLQEFEQEKEIILKRFQITAIKTYFGFRNLLITRHHIICL